VSAGKTGTSQVVALSKNEKYSEATVAEHLRDHALFIAFAPADNPRIALAVLVENAGFGARAAAPVARKVLDFYLLGKDGTKPDTVKPAPPAPRPVDEPRPKMTTAAIRQLLERFAAKIDGRWSASFCASSRSARHALQRRLQAPPDSARRRSTRCSRSR